MTRGQTRAFAQPDALPAWPGPGLWGCRVGREGRAAHGSRPFPTWRAAHYLPGLLALFPGCRRGALPFRGGRRGQLLRDTRAGGPPPRKALGVLQPPRRPLCEARRSRLSEAASLRGRVTSEEGGAGTGGRPCPRAGCRTASPHTTSDGIKGRCGPPNVRSGAQRVTRRTSPGRDCSGRGRAAAEHGTRPALGALLPAQPRAPFPFSRDGVS